MQILYYIVDLLSAVLNSVFNWLSAILIKFGFFPVTLVSAIVVISATFKFILSPYLSGSSDTAKSNKRRK